MANIVCKNCKGVFEARGQRGKKPDLCPDCRLSKGRNYIEYKVTYAKYGWTKWGGARHGLVKEINTEWSCQACGSVQTHDLPAYMIPLNDDQREFMRICSNCMYVSRVERIPDVVRLISIVRDK